VQIQKNVFPHKERVFFFLLLRITEAISWAIQLPSRGTRCKLIVRCT